jgi:simple sugar transport system ATP-binding protein
LRDGELVLSGEVADITQGQLVAAMVGSAPPRKATEIEASASAAKLGDTRLDVKGLNVSSRSGSVYDVDLEVRAGECLGLVGLRGSGSSTVGDAIVGLVTRKAGSVEASGVVGYVPQDRHQRGFVPVLGVDENLTHAVLGRIADRFGVVSSRRRNEIAQSEVQRLQIVARTLDQPVVSLSGGNQQKVVVGRALAAEPSVLVAITPTVGVDVASKEALLDAIAHARDSGVAVLLISDDFDDLRVCTRLLVMVRGRITTSFTRPPWDRQLLISAVEGLEVAV